MRVALVLLLAACSPHTTEDANTVDGIGATDATAEDGGAADPAAPCTTRISYGDRWIHGAAHPSQEDVAADDVTWDGICHDDGNNSYALLSNGWKPYFQGHSGCALALDSSCAPTACSTRITYGDTWMHPASHSTQYDQVAGRVFWDGTCTDSGGNSYAQLSNGWAPHFSGTSACAVSIEWRGCGGLYTNPGIGLGCADPGVLRDGKQYVLTCTGGSGGNAYPLFTSTDLVSWKPSGFILPAAARPAWAKGDFWAPEVHRIGSQYVAYFSAQNTDGRLSIGAASAPTALGPFTALDHPLVHDAQMSLIDANAFVASNGTAYLLWKEDGNAQGKPTPIHAQPLAADGLSLTGTPTTLITNDRAWEDNLVEGPFLVEHAGSFYLFYSGNRYYDGRYAVGVARASSPLGPYTKAADPILVTGGDWVGPGHCSVVDGPDGGTYMVYHAWQLGHVNTPGSGRMLLVDQIVWRDGWPTMPGAPSSASRPLP